MKITVATVCLNAEDTIADTVRSVLNQTCSDLEYLVLDARSIDGTMEILRKFEADPRIAIRSEKDEGLYDAMNRAAKMAQGEYVLYMNSGDRFHDEKVLSDIAPYLGDADILYGGTVREKADGTYEERYHGKRHLMRMLLCGKMPSHQSIITKTKIMRTYGFRKEYPITADFDFLVRAKKDRRNIRYIDRIISIVDCGNGISQRSENLEEMRREDDRSLKENFPGWYWAIRGPKAIYRKVKDCKNESEGTM